MSPQLPATLPKSPPAEFRRYLPLLLAMAIFMQMLDTTVLNTALPAMAADLNVSPLNMQPVIVSYALTLALLIPVSGYLSAKFGTQKVFLAAIGLFSFGSLLCAVSPTLPMLVFSRIVQGIGGALLTPVARLALIKSYEKSELLRVLNFAIMPALMAPIMGPLVGGYLVEWVSWHWIFLINLPVGLLCFLAGWRFMPNYTEQNAHIDIPGILLFGGAAFFLTIGLEFLGSDNKALAFALLTLATGSALLFGYYRYAKTHKNAIYPLSLLSVRTFRVGLNGNLLARLGISSIPLLLPLVLQVSFGYSPSEAGWMIAPMALAAMLTKPLMQKLLQTFGYRNILLANTVLVGVLMISIALHGPDSPKWLLVLHFFILGGCNSIQFTSMNTITLADLRPYQNTSGNSLMAVNQQLAMGFGIALGSLILRFYQQSDALTHQNTQLAFQYTFITIGALTIFSSLVFRQLHKRDGNTLAHRD